MRWWHWMLIGLAAVSMMAAPVVVGLIKRGKRVGPETVRLADGSVAVKGEKAPAAPDRLAAAAKATLEEYALARMISSEEGSQASIVQVGVAWATLNHARAHKDTIPALLLRVRKSGKPASGEGFFGAQWQGRYAATSQDPYEGHLAIARDVLAGRIPDPTGGAQQYDSPAAFGQQKGTTAAMADTIAALRLKTNDKVLLPGIPEKTIRFWRPRLVA